MKPAFSLQKRYVKYRENVRILDEARFCGVGEKRNRCQELNRSGEEVVETGTYSVRMVKP